MQIFPTQLKEFVKRLHALYPERADTLLESMTKEQDVCIRINRLKTTNNQIQDNLTALGFSLSSVSGLPDTFRVQTEGKRISATDEWKQGLFAIQSASSQLVSHILDPKPNELVLDACASPGSKTSHIAMLMHNTGNIVANDASWARMGKLKDVIRQLGVQTVTCTNIPAETLWRDYENTFDRILADVPCTMEGRIRFDDPKSYSDWSLKKIHRLSTEQKGIMRSLARCLKPGGILVYSTCTLAPEENEEVIDWLLRKDDTLELLPIEYEDVPFVDGITKWQSDIYLPELSHCKRILPDDLWEGFFIAKLQKKSE